MDRQIAGLLLWVMTIESVRAASLVDIKDFEMDNHKLESFDHESRCISYFYFLLALIWYHDLEHVAHGIQESRLPYLDGNLSGCCQFHVVIDLFLQYDSSTSRGLVSACRAMDRSVRRSCHLVR